MARTNGAAPTNLLATLSKAPDPPPRPGKSNKAPAVPITGLELYGALCKFAKEIEDGCKPTYGDPIKDAMLDYFIAEGVALGRRPENYDGAEGKVSKASLQLRDKTSQSTISPEHAAELQGLGIRLHADETVPLTLRVKPAVYAANDKLANEMLACLAKNGYPVAEIFEVQDRKFRWVVGPHTLNDLFAKAKEARAKKSNKFTDPYMKQLLKICTSTSITPNWDGTLLEAFEMVRKIIAPTPEELKAQAAPKPSAPVIKTSHDKLTESLKASLAAEGGAGDLYVKPAARSGRTQPNARFGGRKKLSPKGARPRA